MILLDNLYIQELMQIKIVLILQIDILVKEYQEVIHNQGKEQM